jgi:hypothetical protein
MIDRRTMIGLIGGAAVVPFLPTSAGAIEPLSYFMLRDPGCGCCLEWAKRVGATFGRKLPIYEKANMAAEKDRYRVPPALRSCHTALINNLIVEGHVPPVDIKRFLASRNNRILGLAVPGMPAGSPGMDVGHNHKQRYQVMAFDSAGRHSVFATHG